MKRHLLFFLALFLGLLMTVSGFAQAPIAGDQNPAFAVSREKYMKIADSLNSYHGTTRDEIYKAIDWMEDRRQARADRRDFRRQLQLERARYGGYYDYNYYGGYYNNGYYNPYNGYRNQWNGNYRNYPGYRSNNFYITPWGARIYRH